MWQHLKEIALIGTDKKVLETDLLPEAIKETLLKTPKEGPLQYLDSCALAYYYLQQGTKERVYSGEVKIFESSQEEEMASPESIQILKDILSSDESNKMDFVELIIEHLLSKSQVIGHELILPLIKLVSNASLNRKQKVVQVIGEKGRWLLQLTNSLNEAFLEEKNDIWNEGKTEDRKNYFRKSLLTEPEKALSDIQSTWKSESVQFKKSLLQIIKEHTPSVFLPFLEDLYANEFSYSSKEKVSQVECRYILASILVSETSTQLSQQTQIHLQKYIEVKKSPKLLSLVKSASVEIIIPNQADDFLNADQMLQLFGISNKFDTVQFQTDQIAWFAEILSFSRLDGLVDLFNHKIEDLIKHLFTNPLFIKKIASKDEFVLLDALALCLEISSNHQYIPAFTDTEVIAHNHRLLSFMTLDEFEKWIVKNASYKEIAFSPEGEWTEAFSIKVLDDVRAEAVRGNYALLKHMSEHLVAHLHPKSITYLEACNVKMSEHTYRAMWEKHFYAPLQLRLNINHITKH